MNKKTVCLYLVLESASVISFFGVFLVAGKLNGEAVFANILWTIPCICFSALFSKMANKIIP